MKTKIIVTEQPFERLGLLQDMLQERGLHLALPEGLTDVICLDPTDKKARESRFVCFWNGKKPIYKPELPVGTRVVVEA